MKKLIFLMVLVLIALYSCEPNIDTYSNDTSSRGMNDISEIVSSFESNMSHGDNSDLVSTTSDNASADISGDASADISGSTSDTLTSGDTASGGTVDNSNGTVAGGTGGATGGGGTAQ